MVVDGSYKEANLTPDQLAQWKDSVSRYQTAKERIQSGGSFYGDPETQSKALRAVAMKHAAEKREISGLLTGREKAAVDKANAIASRKAARSQATADANKAARSLLPQPGGENAALVAAEPIEPAEARDGSNASPRQPLPPLDHTPGDSATVYTPGNRPVQTHYAVVDADRLIPSQTDTLAPHPQYDQTLQPRDRNRIASLAQIDDIARKLNADRLGASSSTAEGSPIVGADGQVESGNGRALAIRRAYSQYPDSANAYKASIERDAAKFGVKPEDVAATAKPVLVRVREGDLAPADRAALASEMGASPVAARSETEIAAEDGKRLRESNLVSRLNPGTDGSLNTAGNRDFIRQFMATVPDGERAALVQADGSLSAQGERRVRNAVLSAAYDDHATVARLAESTDDNVMGVGKAMAATAGDAIRLKQEIARGDAHPLDLTGDISAAATKLSNLRRQGMTVASYMAQEKMFGSDLSPEAETLLRAFDANKRSPNKIADLLRAYTQSAIDAGSPRQIGLFGDEPAPTKAQVLAQAQKNLARQNADADGGTLFQRMHGGARSTFISPKLNEGVPQKLDSSYELLRVAMHEADPNVEAVTRLGRTIGIPYNDPAQVSEQHPDGKPRTYYPDLLVKRADGSATVEEIKPAAFVDTPTNQAKAAAARTYLETQNTGYQFVSEGNLDMSRQRAALAAAKAGKTRNDDGEIAFQRRVNGSPSAPQKATFGDNLMTAYKAGLVSSPRTVLKIAAANGTMAVGETISSHFAAAADMARVALGAAAGGDKTDLGRIIGTNRAAVGVDLPTLAKASLAAATQGVKGAGKIITTGQPGAANDPLGLQSGPGAFGHASNTGNKVFDTAVNTVFNSHSAATYPAKLYAANASIAAQARLIAGAEANAARSAGTPVSAAQTTARIKALTDAPTQAMATQAIADAAVATFQNPNRLAQGVADFKNAQAGNPFARAAADFAVPIVKIPANAAARALEYAGGGLVSGPVSAGRAIKADLAAPKTARDTAATFAANPTAQNKSDMDTAAKALLTPAFNDAERANFAKSIGRGATGALLMTIGYQLATRGLLTGANAGKGDYQQREKEGVPAQSIRIGGAWHEIDTLSPVGQMLTLGATMREQGAKHGSDLAGYGAAVGSTLADVPLLSEGPLAKLQEKSPGQFATDTATSIIPASVATAAQAIDGGRERDTKAAKGSTGINWNPILARIPFLRQQLAEKTPPKGGTATAPVGGFLAPFNPLKSRTGAAASNPGIFTPKPKATRTGGDFADPGAAIDRKLNSIGEIKGI